jgi:hypothetical protein
VGRHEISVGAGLEGDLEQIAGVQAENGTPVGAEVADAPEGGVEPLDRIEVGQVDEVVHLAGLVVAVGCRPLVDRGDLDRELEPDLVFGGLQALRQLPGYVLGPVGFEGVKPRFSRFQRVLEMGEPRRMGKIAGAEEGDPFTAGPPGEVVQFEIATACTGVLRMDVQIGDEGLRWHAAVCHAAPASVRVTPRAEPFEVPVRTFML